MRYNYKFIVPIKGDASFRTFYRVIFKDRSRKIIISSKKEKYKNLIIYTAINEYLRSNKILTPKLYSHNYDTGLVLVEDFGDITFEKILSKTKLKLKIYKRIVNLLLSIQKIKPPKKIKMNNGKNYFFKKYNSVVLHKESDLFFDWYLPTFYSKKKIKIIKNKTKKELSNLFKKLNFKNSHFVHRDFHASNLMKVKKRIGVIDSQDAVIGNVAYDLASLIDDVRIKTSTKLKNQIFQHYLNKSHLINNMKSKKIVEDFNILSVQRNLKIIGIFSRLSKRDKKNKYLKLIPYAWKLIENRLKDSNLSDLKYILNKYIPMNLRKNK